MSFKTSVAGVGIILSLLSGQALTAGEISGGMSAGGGGVIALPLVTSDNLSNYAQYAKTEIRWALQFFESHKNTSGAFADNIRKLFDDQRVSIYEVLEHAQIYLNPVAPCLDNNGVEQDGSVNTLNPNLVCISSFNLSKKLPIGYAASQLFALIGHEVSHLYGLDEVDAQWFQTALLHHFRVLDGKQRDYDLYQLLSERQWDSFEHLSYLNALQFEYQKVLNAWTNTSADKIRTKLEETLRIAALLTKMQQQGIINYQPEAMNTLVHLTVKAHLLGIEMKAFNNNAEAQQYLQSLDQHAFRKTVGNYIGTNGGTMNANRIVSADNVLYRTLDYAYPISVLNTYTLTLTPAVKAPQTEAKIREILDLIQQLKISAVAAAPMM